MSNILTPSVFKFEDSIPIRSLIKDGEPWFVAKDVCDALDLTNSRMALQSLDDDEKGVSLIYTPGGRQEMQIVSESGLYTLILRCRGAVTNGSNAHRFRKWITSEVLPSIRRTGKYAVPVQPELPIDAGSQNAMASGWIERNNRRVISLMKLAGNMGMRYSQLHGIVVRNPEKFSDGGKLIRTGNYIFLTESGVAQLSELMPSINFQEYKPRSAHPDIASIPDAVGKFFEGKGYTSGFYLTYLMFLNWYNLSEQQMYEVVNTIERMTKARSEELPHLSSAVDAQLAISGIAEVANHMGMLLFDSIKKLVKQPDSARTAPVSMRMPLEMIQQIHKELAPKPPVKGFRKTAMAHAGK